MKNYLLFLLFVVIVIGTKAQTSTLKNNFSAGFGLQNYNLCVDYSRYICKSFDATLSLRSGDFGHCREEDEKAIRDDGTEVLNMRSRLTSAIISFRYKFANDCLIKASAKLAPFIYAGAGLNKLRDIWTSAHDRVNEGTYASLNFGAGLRYQITDRYSFSYNLHLGYFMSDAIDKVARGKDDMYIQNIVMLGINLF